jgi:hypothetical protein
VFGKGATVQQFQKQHPDVLYWGEFIVWWVNDMPASAAVWIILYDSIPLHRKISERVSFELLYFNLLNIISHIEQGPCYEELLSRSYKRSLISSAKSYSTCGIKAFSVSSRILLLNLSVPSNIFLSKKRSAFI